MEEENTQNQILGKLERRARKRAAREAEAARFRRKRLFKKISYWLIGLLIVGGAGWLLVSAASLKGPDYSQAYPILERNHIVDGSTASYNSDPPTSGPHYAVPAPVRFYNEELPDERLVHNLEHGQIWIAYRPNLSPDVMSQLKNLAGGDVVVAMRSKNNTDIALVAWGRLDKFNIENNELPRQRVEDFIKRYRGHGPENPNNFSHFN